MKEIWKRHKSALLFIAVFIGIYLVFNTLYGIYIENYYPGPDPVTYLVSKQTIQFLSIFYEEINIIYPEQSNMIPVLINDIAVLEIFEGCNSLNVIFVYVSFIIAFRGNLKSTIAFLGIGILVIYIMNIARLSLLIISTQSFPDYFYFLHKYFFTASIYLVVFIIWYFWVKHVSKST